MSASVAVGHLPLVLGGNVFGWTADLNTSFDLLDTYYSAGGRHVDTADVYSVWASGHVGGESETVVGRWLRSRRPEGVTVATKVGAHPDRPGLSAANIRAAARDSLARLGVERLDLYYAHYDDETTPLDEVVGAFQELVDAGLVGSVGLSNYTGDRIRAWQDTVWATGAVQPVALQPHYNLLARSVEQDILPLARAAKMDVYPHSSLASGFLTGKYRTRQDLLDIARAPFLAQYATPRNFAVLDVLRQVARDHGAPSSTTALAWLRSRPEVTAPVVSASSAEQLTDLIAGTRLRLDEESIDRLNDATSPPVAWSD